MQSVIVEIKGFGGPSEMAELEKALGQFALYRTVMKEVEPERSLYLAVPQKVMEGLFQDDLGRLILQENLAQVVSFDPVEEVLVQWTN